MRYVQVAVGGTLAAVVMSATTIPAQAAPSINTGCLRVDGLKTDQITLFLKKPSSRQIDWFSIAGKQKASYSISRGTNVTAGVAASGGVSFGAGPFAEVRADVEVSISKSWSADETFSFTRSVPAGKVDKLRLRLGAIRAQYRWVYYKDQRTCRGRTYSPWQTSYYPRNVEPTFQWYRFNK